MSLINNINTALIVLTLIPVVLWLLKNWIKAKFKSAIKHEYSVNLEIHKNQLQEKTEKTLLELKNQTDLEFEKYKVRIGPYSEKQFERYNELWVKMVDMKYAMNNLWDHASKRELEQFSCNLRELVSTLEKSALLVESKHYNELMDSMKVFSQYQFGKESLIRLRRVSMSRDSKDINEQISQLINENGKSRERLLQALSNLMDSMRNQINGTMK